MTKETIEKKLKFPNGKTKYTYFNPLIAVFFGPVIIGALSLVFILVYNLRADFTELTKEAIKTIAEMNARISNIEKDIALIKDIEKLKERITELELKWKQEQQIK